MPGAMYVLHVAADDFWARLADAVDGERGAGSETSARIFSADERDFLRRRHLQHPQGPRAGSLREVQTAEVPVVIDGARAQRLRNSKGDGGWRSAALYRGLRIRRRANPEKHQEGRNRRDGARLHEELPQSRDQGAWRLYHRLAGRDERYDSKDH